MKYIGAIFALVFLMLLSGCATLSKSECLTGDWRAIGERDGRSGYSSARFADHNEACAKHGVTANRTFYEQGRQTGLRYYCTPSNAAKVGLAGRTYSNVCEGEAALSFVRVYRQAKDVADVDAQIKRTLDRVEKLSGQIADSKTTKAEREAYADEIRWLNLDLPSLNLRRAREDSELRQVLLEEQARFSR